MKKFLILVIGAYLLGIAPVPVTAGDATPVVGAQSKPYIHIPPLKARAGETINVQVMVDCIEKMAGVKLSLRYDAALLTYVSTQKPAQASAMLHIVNAKQPGKLILVMAGARGIRIKNAPLATFTFQVTATVSPPKEFLLEITELQLMSEQLKEIIGFVKNGKIQIDSN